MRRRILKEGTLLGNCLSSCNGSTGREMPFTREDVFSYKRKLVANLVSIRVKYIFLSLLDEESQINLCLNTKFLQFETIQIFTLNIYNIYIT